MLLRAIGGKTFHRLASHTRRGGPRRTFRRCLGRCGSITVGGSHTGNRTISQTLLTPDGSRRFRRQGRPTFSVMRGRLLARLVGNTTGSTSEGTINGQVADLTARRTIKGSSVFG